MATAHGDSFHRAGRGRSSCAASAASSAANACSACGRNACAVSAPGALPPLPVLPAPPAFAGAEWFWLGSTGVGSTDTDMAEAPSSSAGSDLVTTVHHGTDNVS
ncbi:hypothetical protein ACE1SV_23340 [Streptomyces sennicomposti]